MKKSKVSIVAAGLLLAVGLYVSLAWNTFQWRNPTANRMAFVRDFGSVVTWRRLDRYQPNHAPQSTYRPTGKCYTCMDPSLGCDCNHTGICTVKKCPCTRQR